jgi:hypothetical protein
MTEIMKVCKLPADFNLQTALMQKNSDYYRFTEDRGTIMIAANEGHQFPIYSQYKEISERMLGLEIIYKVEISRVEDMIIDGITPDKHGYIWLGLKSSQRELKARNEVAIKLKWQEMLLHGYRIFRHKNQDIAVTKGLHRNHTQRCYVSPKYIEAVCYPSTACLAEINGTWLPIKQVAVHQHGYQVETLAGKVSIIADKNKINGVAQREWLPADPLAVSPLPRNDTVDEEDPIGVAISPPKYNLRQRHVMPR